MFCQSHTTKSKHSVPAVNRFQKDVWPCKKINLLKGFQKKPWPYLFWPYHSPLTQRCSTSLLCHADIWIALDVLNIFSQCYRHGIDICAFDVMQIFFLLFYLPFFLPCTDALTHLCSQWHRESVSSSLSNHSFCLTQCTAATFTLSRPSLFILRFCCCWKFACPLKHGMF